MSEISKIYQSLSSDQIYWNKISSAANDHQNEIFFRLAVSKSNRKNNLINYFCQKPPKRLIISANLARFEFNSPGIEVCFLENDFFRIKRPESVDDNNLLDGSIVIVSNHDIGDNQTYGDIYDRHDKTIFVVWDVDNHHWESCPFIAAHSDIYAPGHHENLYFLSRYNWTISGPVYCATVQWSRNFLSNHLYEIMHTERSNIPLGMHIMYMPFLFRNRVITTLRQYYPSINFTDMTFHDRTPVDRLREWYSHKTHWVVPVLNDVAERIFDALITGGIPIVPESLRMLPLVSEINRKYIVFYNPEDIVNPQKIVEKANKLFDDGGVDGILERQHYAMDYHHGDCRIRQILEHVFEIFQTKFSDIK